MAGYTNLESFKSTLRQRGMGSGALAGKIARTAFPIFRKNLLPTAKKLGKDALEAALPELGELIAGRSSIKKATKRTAKKTKRKQLGGGKRKKTNRKKRETILVNKSGKNQRLSREGVKNISWSWQLLEH